jgi:hypothetical protein
MFQNVEVTNRNRIKNTLFSDVTRCSLVEVFRRYGGTYCLHHPYSLKLGTVRSTETSTNFYQTTQRHIPYTRNGHLC